MKGIPDFSGRALLYFEKRKFPFQGDSADHVRPNTRFVADQTKYPLFIDLIQPAHADKEALDLFSDGVVSF